MRNHYFSGVNAARFMVALLVACSILLPMTRPVSAAIDAGFGWAVGLGGTGNDVGFGIAVGSDGSVLTTGYFNGTVDFDPGPGIANLTSLGQGDIFVSKVDSAGNFVWVNRIGGTNHEFGKYIAVGADDSVYVTGLFSGTVDFDPGLDTHNLTSAGWQDVFVCKLDSDGNFLWAKQFGGIYNESVEGIAVAADGSVTLAGTFDETVDFDPGPGTAFLTSAGQEDIFVIKFNSMGNFVWVKQIGGSNPDRINGIAIHGDESIYLTGYFTGTSDVDPGDGISNLTLESGNFFISKLDSAGNFVWAKPMRGTTTFRSTGIAIGSDGGVYTTGWFGGTADFDPGEGVYNLTSQGMEDVFISKLDEDGDFVWAKRLGGVETDLGNDIKIGRDGNLYTTGYFQNEVIFGSMTLSTSDEQAPFICRLDNNGNIIWAKQMDSRSYIHDIAISRDRDVYLTGYFVAPVDFDPSSETFTISPNGGVDIFISKLVQMMEAPQLLAITRRIPLNELTNADILTFRVHFSESMVGVDTADFAVYGGSTAEVSGISEVSLSVYDVSVSGGDLAGYNGTVGLVLSASQDIYDLIGNSLSAEEPLTVMSYLLKNSAPTIDSITRQNPVNELTNADALTFRVSFSEDVTGVDGADFAVIGGSTAVVSAVSPVSASVYDVSVSGGDLAGYNGTVGLVLSASQDIRDLSGNSLANEIGLNNQTYLVNNVIPTISGNSLDRIMLVSFNQIEIIFNKQMYDPTENHESDDVTNPQNYMLVYAGEDKVIQTETCSGGLAGDDLPVQINQVVYDEESMTATLMINNGKKLSNGIYRLLACGTTTLTDISGNKLGGGEDIIFDFTIAVPSQLPVTGFPMGQVTILRDQQAEKAYAGTEMELSIPSLGVSLPIVGVPLSENGWDTSWLGRQAGYLAGSAFPTWEGNTVITGHVWDANNQPGAFANIKSLKYGDQIVINAFGQVYNYEVQTSHLITTYNVKEAFKSEDLDWLTLLTCEKHNSSDNSYAYRRVVRAVLVSVK
jgi:LPXTG-site transpeptidase (sortase) family protein